MIDMTKFDFSKTVLATLDITMVECTRERVVCSMPVTPRVHQPYGVMHGGVSVVLAETVASVGSVLFIDPQHQMAVGLEINANHIRSKRDGVVKAVGVPIHAGRRTIVWEIRVLDEADDLICISRCTMAVVDLDDNMAKIWGEKNEREP